MRYRRTCLVIILILGLAVVHSAPTAPHVVYAQAGSGNCAAVLKAVTQDSTYGTHVFYSAAWSYGTVSDAVAAAKTSLLQQARGATLITTFGNTVHPGGIWTVASSCGSPHGAVATELKTIAGKNDQYVAFGPGVYNEAYAAFENTTDEASAKALSACTTGVDATAQAQFCHVTSLW